MQQQRVRGSCGEKREGMRKCKRSERYEIKYKSLRKREEDERLRYEEAWEEYGKKQKVKH